MSRESVSARRTPSFVAACATSILLSVLAAATFSNGGWLEREATLFIVQYSAGGSFLVRVFDPYANDFGTYQARELSFLVDYLDASIYLWLFRTFGHSVFIPFSAVLSAGLLAATVFHGAKRHTRLNAWLVALIFSCLASSFVFLSTLGLFYRSGKPLLSAVLLALLFALLGAWREPGNRGRIISIAALAAVAGLLDRQGVFYVASLTLVQAVLARSVKEARPVAGALLLVLMGLQLYNFVLAPTLVEALNGYRPDFSYQHIPSAQLWRLPVFALLAVQMLGENAFLMLGGHWAVTAAIVIVLLVLLLMFDGTHVVSLRRIGGWKPNRVAVRLATCAAGLQVVMFAVMIARHPPVFAALDHRYWYYPLPFLATVLFGLTLGVDAFLRDAGVRRRRMVAMGLMAVIVGNLASHSRYKSVMASGEWFAAIRQQSAAARRSIATGRLDPELTTDYARFVRLHGLR